MVVANLRDLPEAVDRILAKTASIRCHYDMLRAVHRRPSTLLSSYRHIKHELKKLSAIEVLIDLVGQLEVSLNGSIDESQLDQALQIMVELDDLFRTIVSLSGWKGLTKLSARRKNYQIRLSNIQKRLEDCLQLLIITDVSSSASTSSSLAPSCVEAIVALPASTNVLTNQRLRRALFASKLVERGLEAVPVAGKYVSAVAGVATLLLERRTDKCKQRKILQQIQLQLQAIVKSLIEAGVLENVPQSSKAHIKKTTPERLTNKIGELNLLIESANRLLRASYIPNSSLSTSNLESELSELTDQISAFRDQIHMELSVLETHIQLHAMHLSVKTMQTQLKLAVGIFF